MHIMLEFYHLPYLTHDLLAKHWFIAELYNVTEVRYKMILMYLTFCFIKCSASFSEGNRYEKMILDYVDICILFIS